jgi:DNA repair ATPase RecN
VFWILIRAALTGVFGSAFGKWFLSTRMGRWFQTKLDRFMEYLANKYDIHLAKKEAKWRTEFPHLADRIDNMESSANKYKNKTDDLISQLDKFRNEIKLTREQTNEIRDLAMDIVKKNS